VDREQMIAHLGIHGWVPYANVPREGTISRAWCGCYNGRHLVYVYDDATPEASAVVIAQMHTEGLRSSWEDITTAALALCFQRVMEGDKPWTVTK
jgi:hypothetical protein